MLLHTIINENDVFFSPPDTRHNVMNTKHTSPIKAKNVHYVNTDLSKYLNKKSRVN